MNTLSVGAHTKVCSLSEQVKKYKSKSITKGSINQSDEEAQSRRRPVESLMVQCLHVLTKHFCAQPSVGGIPNQFLPEITKRLPVDLDIKASAPYIVDENYWKRCCLNRPGWANREIEQHGLTWKQLYVELNLQEMLENFDPSRDNLENLLRCIHACQDSVFALQIEQLLSHLDMDQICALLPNLTRLCLTYGVKHIGMKYERMLFGMKISDATSLARCIKYTSTLTTLNLPRNLLDDDLLRMLMTGLIKNSTITCLDLSHNKITNHGARLIAKLLGPKSVLSALNLCDNQIHSEGGRYLSRGLHHNTSLRSLNMRLNRLTDEGGRMLLDGITPLSNLETLQLSSNSLGTHSAKSLAKLVQENSKCRLKVIDVTGNDFNEQDAHELLSGLTQSTTICAFDLRRNRIPPDAECLVQIAKVLRRNEISLRNQQQTILE